MASSYRHAPGFRRNDPDETEGRLLYRELAEAAGRRSVALARKVTLHPSKALGVDDGGLRAPPLRETRADQKDPS